MSAPSLPPVTGPIGVQHEIEPKAQTDIVVAITAHLANELHRDIPVVTRIKIFWSFAEALQHTAPHQQIKQAFFIIAEQTGLIPDLGHHGDEDVRHVVDWALRGRFPFESSKRP